MALTDNLFAYYKFDESSGDAADSAGGGLTMTNQNTATYVAGKIGNAAHMVRASSQYFSRSNGGAFNSATGTINCWIKYDVVTSVLTIFDSATGSFGGISFRIDDRSGLDAYMGGSGVEINGATAPLTSGTW